MTEQKKKPIKKLSERELAEERMNKLFVRIKRSQMIAGDGQDFIDHLRGIKSIYVEDFIDDQENTKNEEYKGYLRCLTDLLDAFAGCDKDKRPAQGE